MKNYEKKGIKSEQGFTMIELIIVIAIIGILSAILVPSFTTMSRKSKLRADISSVKQVQTQIDMYMAENDGKFPGATNKLEEDNGTIAALVTGNYLKKSDTVNGEGKVLNLQSNGPKLIYDDSVGVEHLKLQFDHSTHKKEAKAAVDVTGADAEWISVTGTATTD